MKKEKKTEEYEGIGDNFSETGTEGIIWSLQKNTSSEDKEWSYDNLVPLENGDELTIYDKEIFLRDNAKRKVIVWKGKINFETKSHLETTRNGYYTGQCIYGMWCHGIQKTKYPDAFHLYFFRNYPMKLVRTK